MLLLGRRAFTLVEMLVALTLLAIVGAAIYRVLVNNQRFFQSQTQRMNLQQNLRTAATVFASELHELDATDGDIAAMSATSITFRAMRTLGFVCNPPVLGAGLSGLTMTVRNWPSYGRAFNPATDSLLIFYEGDGTTRKDDNWEPAVLVSLTPNISCPDNTPGQRLTMNLQNFAAPMVNQPGMITAGSPVRAFEVVTYRAYQWTDGNWYVVLQTASGTQPAIGPITSSTGLTFTYYDATGAVTAVRTSVASIGVTVRVQTAQVVQRGGVAGGWVTAVDSMTTQVTLRNDRRF